MFLRAEMYRLSKRRGEADLYPDPQGIACGYYLKDADYELFVMFLLPMLWTASIFTLLFSRHVGLIAPPPICAPVTDYLLITL